MRGTRSLSAPQQLASRRCCQPGDILAAPWRLQVTTVGRLKLGYFCCTAVFFFLLVGWMVQTMWGYLPTTQGLSPYHWALPHRCLGYLLWGVLLEVWTRDSLCKHLVTNVERLKKLWNLMKITWNKGKTVSIRRTGNAKISAHMLIQRQRKIIVNSFSLIWKIYKTAQYYSSLLK